MTTPFQEGSRMIDEELRKVTWEIWTASFPEAVGLVKSLIERIELAAIELVAKEGK